MIGLRSARVLIVDEDESEALPIMKALAKKGIPCAYFHGANLKELPEEKDKFLGIRLAVLDMDLVPGVGDEKSKISTLISCLERLLSPDNGPYIALIWTNNPGLKDLFEKNIFSNTNLPNPIDIIMLTKAECKNKGELDIGIIEAKIENTFRSFSPLKIIQAWEGKNFEAATEVTGILSTFITDEKNPEKWRDAWKVQILNLMFSLAKEAVGENVDNSSALAGLYNSLNPLHADRMENYINDLSILLADDAKEILKHTEACGAERKAKINTMLHLAFEENGKYANGDIYKFESDKVPSWGLSLDNLLQDFVQKEYDSEEKRKEISSKWKYVIVEINASCDHAYSNVRAARFLSGLIIPVSEQGNIKKSGDDNFIWKLGSIFVKKDGLDGLFSLYFSARHLVTCPIDEVAKLTPFARLRSQAFTDLQAWFARQASRPGYLLLKD